ncbi:MAG TPA: restriction endonuclease subunit S, partial [Fimbriimonadaceae bacterium]|nr:restriction endonuclease subunit S [Fimbriimonadaceae bacterium]
DALIKNNRRRIKLLEEAAQLIYREWFVRLRFPGHEHTKIENGVPEGWNKRKIGDYSPFAYGKALKEDNRVPGPFPVFGSSGQVGTHEKALVAGPGIIIGRKGNVGAVYWSDADFFPIDTTYYIDSARASLFLFHALSDVPFINTDVAVPGLNRDMAHSREIVIPCEAVLKEFEDQASTIQRQVRILKAQVFKLQEARDLLLPRLMSGEIEV